MAGRKIGLLLGAALVLAAVGGWLAADEEEEYGGFYEAEDLHEILGVFEVLTADLTSPASALATATKDRAGQCLEMELTAARSKDGPVIVWDIDLLTEKGLAEVVVDARSGKVLANEEEEDEEVEPAKRLVSGAKAPLGEILASLEKTVAGRVVLVELEREGGLLVWEAKVVHAGRLGEIAVSAATGKILPVVEGEDEGDDDEGEGGEEEDD